MMCAVLGVTGVNQDLCDGRSKERLAHMNTDYKFQVETMVSTKKWVDQFGVTEDKITPEQMPTDTFTRVSRKRMSTKLSVFFTMKTSRAKARRASSQTVRDQVRRAWRRPPMLFSTLPTFRRPRTASTLLRCMCSSIKSPRSLADKTTSTCFKIRLPCKGRWEMEVELLVRHIVTT